MRVGILGPLQVVADDGTRRDPAASRQRRLLLALLVSRPEPVSVDRLVDTVWPDGALPRDPVAALRTYVTRLRATLEPEHVGGQPHLLVGGGDHYRLCLDGHELDAAAFEQDLAHGIAAAADDPVEALRWLDLALARWRGPALMEVADEHWAMPEAARLDELRIVAAEHRAGCLIDSGAHAEATGELERLVRQHPLRERPHGLLMLALDRAGRVAEAAEVFRAFRERLADETGLDPSPDLQQLCQRLLAASSTTTFAQAGGAGTWNEVPAAPTPLIGRDDELATVTGLLTARRLVTLTGAGGAGKTRVATELARAHVDDGGNAVFVDLSRLTDGDGVTDAVFEALRLPAVARAQQRDGLVRVLRTRPALLVMDNCEHVVGAVSRLVDDLVPRCPDLTVLATSREPLGSQGERVYRMPSLDEGTAIALFADRAAAAGAATALGPAETAHVREICARLDGLPLAIELAAKRAAHMTVADIAAHLDERFWLLTGGRRSLPRQQTLEAAIAWSYDLLDAGERFLLRAASVFVGSFDADALAAVAQRSSGEAVDGLASLVAKSLVDTAAAGGRGRYRLPESVRLYGLDRLHDDDESAARRAAHADHYLARALRHGPQVHDLPPGGGERTMCRIRMNPVPDAGEPDLANHVAALEWFDRHADLLSVGRLAARMVTVLDLRGFLDAERRYLGRDDVAAALADRAERAMYLTASALNATYFGAFGEQLRLARGAMACATDPATRAAASALTALAMQGVAPAEVPALVDAALVAVPPDARFTRVLLRGQRSLSLVMRGHLAEAVEHLAEHARHGDVFAASELMLVLHILGRDEEALAVPVPADGEPEHTALWSYRWALARALAAAAAHRPADAAAFLLQAAAGARSSPVALLDRDVLLGCAAVAHHAGRSGDAAGLLAAVAGRTRSPAGFALYRHYAALTAPAAENRGRVVLADADAGEVLEHELERLRQGATHSHPAAS